MCVGGVLRLDAELHSAILLSWMFPCDAYFTMISKDVLLVDAVPRPAVLVPAGNCEGGFIACKIRADI